MAATWFAGRSDSGARMFVVMELSSRPACCDGAAGVERTRCVKRVGRVVEECEYRKWALFDGRRVVGTNEGAP